jgi:hypothetical protein
MSAGVHMVGGFILDTNDLKYYQTANEFEASIVNCLDKINSVKKHKVNSLMTLKFQLFPNPLVNQKNSLNAAA